MAELCLRKALFKILQKLGIQPLEGLRLTFYNFDADNEDRPMYLCADGVLHFDEMDSEWCAFVDKKTFRTIPRVD